MNAEKPGKDDVPSGPTRNKCGFEMIYLAQSNVFLGWPACDLVDRAEVDLRVDMGRRRDMERPVVVHKIRWRSEYGKAGEG